MDEKFEAILKKSLDSVDMSQVLRRIVMEAYAAGRSEVLEDLEVQKKAIKKIQEKDKT